MVSDVEEAVKAAETAARASALVLSAKEILEKHKPKRPPRKRPDRLQYEREPLPEGPTTSAAAAAAAAAAAEVRAAEAAEAEEARARSSAQPMMTLASLPSSRHWPLPNRPPPLPPPRYADDQPRWPMPHPSITPPSAVQPLFLQVGADTHHQASLLSPLHLPRLR